MKKIGEIAKFRQKRRTADPTVEEYEEYHIFEEILAIEQYKDVTVYVAKSGKKYSSLLLEPDQEAQEEEGEE